MSEDHSAANIEMSVYLSRGQCSLIWLKLYSVDFGKYYWKQCSQLIDRKQSGFYFRAYLHSLGIHVCVCVKPLTEPIRNVNLLKCKIFVMCGRSGSVCVREHEKYVDILRKLMRFVVDIDSTFKRFIVFIHWNTFTVV